MDFVTGWSSCAGLVSPDKLYCIVCVKLIDSIENSEGREGFRFHPNCLQFLADHEKMLNANRQAS